jgi:hypothetical protein
MTAPNYCSIFQKCNVSSLFIVVFRICGGDMFLRNGGNQPQDYILSHPRRQQSTFSPLWKSQISYNLTVAYMKFLDQFRKCNSVLYHIYSQACLSDFPIIGHSIFKLVIIVPPKSTILFTFINFRACNKKPTWISSIYIFFKKSCSIVLNPGVDSIDRLHLLPIYIGTVSSVCLQQSPSFKIK